MNLETLRKEGWIDGVDVAFAKRASGDGDQQLLLCHLLRAARRGHVAVRYEGGRLDPHPRAVWETLRYEEEGVEASAKEPAWDQLEERILSACKDVKMPVCAEGGAVYLDKLHTHVVTVRKHWERLKIMTPYFAVSWSEPPEGLLQPEQAAAIRHALDHSLTVITGGPGTGKTYTAGHLLRMFWEDLSEEDRARCQIALAAPTGKAAAHLEQKIAQTMGEMPHPQAVTLHRLLGRTDEKIPLLADFLLIDEASMIDLPLMARLLRRVKQGARIVFLGDGNQLPSVDVGAVFRGWTLRGDHVVALSRSIRTGEGPLLTFAEQIRTGDVEGALTAPIEWIPFPEGSVRDIQQEIVHHVKPMYAEESFRFLCPLRRGPFGTATFNRLLHDALGGNEQPIILTRTDENRALFNGECGLLHTREKGRLQIGDTAHFTHPDRTLPALLLPPFEWAYCLSVHKAQGSEFDTVFILLPPGSASFGREMLYTAVTRAKKRVILCAEKETLQTMIEKTALRVS